MDLGGIVLQAINLTSSFNLWLVLAIFLITLTAEFGLSIPYLLESMWILIGYGVSSQMLSPSSIVIFCLVGLIGREIGASMLYRVSGKGSKPVFKLFNKLFEPRPDNVEADNIFKRYIILPFYSQIEKLIALSPKDKSTSECQATTFFDRVSCHSPFSVALGRFIWLKIPITITMGMARKLLILLIGVALFSLAWDSLYILIGVFGAGGGIGSSSMLIYTISGFIIIQIILSIIRRWKNARRFAYAKS